jgi:hypothetical protein
MTEVAPYVLCIDVGGPKKIGWANSDGKLGSGADLEGELMALSKHLRDGGRAALGFEAPIWTPARSTLAEITKRRGGVETTFNRAWAAGGGVGALGAALALMPWCLTRLAKDAGPVPATVDLRQFQESGGLLLWEAFVSGSMKSDGTSHPDDAQRACKAFIVRWPNLISDIPFEPAINHAVSSALAVGMSIDLRELVKPALVISVAAQPPAPSVRRG